MSVTTWADGFGVWHARVSRYAASPLIDARRALRQELTLRESPSAPVAREIYMRPVSGSGHAMKLPASTLTSQRALVLASLRLKP